VTKKVTTLDEMFERIGSLPNLIKIDVEGYGIPVLRGARRMLSRKPCPILCEAHPGYWETMNQNADDFAELMAHLGYRSFELTGAPSVDFGKMKMVVLRHG
jgi:hypothetical protein